MQYFGRIKVNAVCIMVDYNVTVEVGQLNHNVCLHTINEQYNICTYRNDEIICSSIHTSSIYVIHVYMSRDCYFNWVSVFAHIILIYCMDMNESF